MTKKFAIFNERDQLALLGACEGDGEYIPIWLMMRCGMHPSDVSSAGTKVKFDGQYISWNRVKNSEARHELVPPDFRDRLEAWLKRGKKLTREGYWHLVGRIGARIGHSEYSPLTLRHTFGTQELKRYMNQPRPPPDPFDLVAKKMGCSESTVKGYYIDFNDWERIGRS
jgi:integrase